MEPDRLEELQVIVGNVLRRKIKTTAAIQQAADQLLGCSELLKSLSRSEREKIVDTLFPFFSLIPGWREVAEQGDVNKTQIGKVVARRALAVKSQSDAIREWPFLSELVREPRYVRQAYRPLVAPYLADILAMLKRCAPELHEQLQGGRGVSWLLAADDWHRRSGRSRRP